jgi:hypothetical protein
LKAGSVIFCTNTSFPSLVGAWVGLAIEKEGLFDSAFVSPLSEKDFTKKACALIIF